MLLSAAGVRDCIIPWAALRAFALQALVLINSSYHSRCMHHQLLPGHPVCWSNLCLVEVYALTKLLCTDHRASQPWLAWSTEEHAQQTASLVMELGS